MNRGLSTGLKATQVIPPGVVWEFVGTTVPAGWLICDGSAVSRTQYPDLFGVIGIQHGAGDGNTTFNLPDHRGRAGVGQDVNQTEFNVVGLTGGFKNKIASHVHDMTHLHNRSAAASGTSTGGASATNTQFVAWWAGLSFAANGQSANHSHGTTTTTLGGGHADGLQGWAANDNHVSVQTTNRTGQLIFGGYVTGENGQHGHSMPDHRHALETHNHASSHTHADTFANPAPNVSGDSSQVDPSQPSSGNLQPYIVTQFIVKY